MPEINERDNTWKAMREILEKRESDCKYAILIVGDEKDLTFTVFYEDRFETVGALEAVKSRLIKDMGSWDQ